MAVDLFFSLSGFIFFCLYSTRIAQRAVSTRAFVTLRFSRLYPLHLATLLLTLVLQNLYRAQHEAFFVNQANDTYNFVLQLFLASNWLPGAPFSFNGPIWSVSVEVLLYAIFFIVCLLGFGTPRFSVIAAVAGATISFKFPTLGRGLFSFFLGGLVFFGMQRITNGPQVRRSRLTSALAVFLLISAGIILSGLGTRFGAATHPTIASITNALFHRAIKPENWNDVLGTWFVRAVGFPALILLLALSENALSGWARRLEWLGNITYSSYLLHFPLQLVVVLVVQSLALSVDYTSHLVFAGFVAVLVGLSHLSFVKFERPAQDFLRRRLASTEAKTAALNPAQR